MGRVLRTRTHLEDGKNLGAGVDDQPQKDARVERSAVWFAVHPTGGEGAKDGEM